MITAKQAYEIAKEWMGPFALVSAGYEIDTHKRRVKNRIGHPGNKRI